MGNLLRRTLAQEAGRPALGAPSCGGASRGRACGQLPVPAAQGLGGSISAGLSSSTLTSLKVSPLTFLAKRAGRYMSHTHASVIETSKNTSPDSVRAFTSTWLHR